MPQEMPRLVRGLLIAIFASGVGLSLWLDVWQPDVLIRHPMLPNLLAGFIGFPLATFVLGPFVRWATSRELAQAATQAANETAEKIHLQFDRALQDALAAKFSQAERSNQSPFIDPGDFSEPWNRVRVPEDLPPSQETNGR